MPIFGLVWVASWVGCFFPSSQELLRAPVYPACVLSGQITNVQASRSQIGRSFTALLPNPTTLPRSQIASEDSQVVNRQGDEPVRFGVPFSAGLVSSSTTSLFKGIKPDPGGFLKIIRGALFELHIAKPASKPPLPVTFAQVKAASVPEVGRRQALISHTSAARISTACSPEQSLAVVSLRDRGHFQIKVGDVVVGEALTRKRAVFIVQQLKQLLHDPQFKPEQIQPGFFNGLPAVKAGDRPLFALEQELTQQPGCNTELLAIQWANRLRTALSASLLPLPVAQQTMYQLEATNQTLAGLASWYGPYFHGRQTATGETFDQNDFTAAHPSLPFNTYLKVTNLDNGKSVIVRINDRGPYFENRTLDLSREAARSLDSETTGVIPIAAVIMKSTDTDVSHAKTSTLAKL